jgi:2-oxoisovalerate ferredoxin oxidoreductase gamma subunit
MIEVIFYGRGGQGGVVASKVLASAFFHEGKYVQSFPAFGGERRGAPVKAFLRADEKAIRRRSLIYRADHAILLDETLPEEIPVHNEVNGAQSIVINSPRPPDTFIGMGPSCIGTVDANAIAEEIGLGSTVMPIVNTIMLGAFAKISKMVDIESITKAIEKNISIKPEDNILGALRAYKEVKEAKGGVNDRY